jgi:hypothetical protein
MRTAASSIPKESRRPEMYKAGYESDSRGGVGPQKYVAGGGK